MAAMSRWSWTAAASVLLLLGLLALRQVASPDVGFHLKAGNSMLAGEGWPRTDTFTFTVAGQPYIDTSWGYQVVLALLERGLGAPGLVLAHALLVLAIFVLLILTARLVAGGTLLAAALALLGGLAAEARFEVRPELLSYAFLAIVLALLHRRAEGRTVRLALLPAIFLVWANSHSLFILGWVAIACFVADSSLRHRRLDRELAAWGAACVAVTLANPYGWRALAFPFTLATRMQGTNVFGQNIGEFVSPLSAAASDQLSFYLLPLCCYFLFASLVLLSMLPLFRQRRWACLLLCLVFLPLSLMMVRNIPLLIVACLPGTVLAFRTRPWQSNDRLRRAVSVAVAALALIASLRVAHDAYYIGHRRLDRFGLGWNALTQPIAAVDYANRVGLDSRVLNHLNFGGYLMWARPEPVFIDGRLEVMGEQFYTSYRRAMSSEAELDACVARYEIGWIILPYRLAPELLGGLSRDRDWRLVYVDHLAAIFVQESAGAQDLTDESVRGLARPAGGPPDLQGLPGLGGGSTPGTLAHWTSGLLRAQSYPVAAFNRGLLHMLRGEPGRAADELARAVSESSGAYPEIYSNLGSALLEMRRFSDARECFRIALNGVPFYRPERRERLVDLIERSERER